ncbi:MAG: hypothetical protein JWO82_629 [Akkermansiaceae bacterium]|nr:hypothetical protein [Akkermansiaceae bacterium]
MKYGEGPPDGFSRAQWRSALHLQQVPEERLTRAQKELVNRPRLWNGRDPHGDLWTARQRREWDAAIYAALDAEIPELTLKAA